MRSPVLFLVFNRPKSTKNVFDAIRLARPPRLYIAADGPRSGRLGEGELCKEVREVADCIDWDCEVKTLFRSENLGCKAAVSSAIDWFFDQEEEGIILEDDILPAPTFFSYCDELLERYRYNENIGLVSGCNLIANRFHHDSSYFFSRYSHIWGWATWRRTWKCYDVHMSSWPTWRDSGGLKKIPGTSRRFIRHWNAIFNLAYAGEIDTWDYQLLFTCWKKNLLTILPVLNQTHNIGFGVNATHTHGEVPRYVRDSLFQNLNFPLYHPLTVQHNELADKLLDKHVFNISLTAYFYSLVRTTPFLGDVLSGIKHFFIRLRF